MNGIEGQTCSRHTQSRRDFLRAAASSIALLQAGILFGDIAGTAPGAKQVKYYGVFSELPVGAVKPTGWIRGWLERQLDGLTGHPENMAYPYDTCMYAGKIGPPPVTHGADWWAYEQSGYFVDGAVRLGHLLDDPRAKIIPDKSLKYIAEHSGSGKLGESVWGWPNTVVGRALMAEAGATGDPKWSQLLDACVQGTVHDGGRDGYLFEEALFLYAISGEAELLEFAKKEYEHYFLTNPKSFSHIDKIHGAKPLHEHGVTAAEQLKLLPLIYCHTGDPQALELANLAYRKVEKDSLMPDGGMVSSESLGNTAFDSLHETCDITDWSWSLGYLLMASGDAHWADLIEQMIFNALPGAVTKDFKQLQYFSSANQMLASNTACPRQAVTRMSYRSAHETECCSGNVNRAMPNYVTRMWMRTEDGIAATLYGPCELTMNLGGQTVTIIEETEYPFRKTITFRVKTSRPVAFAMALRIPQWCTTAEILVNNQPASVECKPGTFAVVHREYLEGDSISLRLSMTVQLKKWFDGKGVSVVRGPLVYSVPVAENRIESDEDPAPIRHILKGNNIQGFPAVEYYPAGQWRYGIQSKRLDATSTFKVIESPMPENPFVSEAAPVRIEVPLQELPKWAADWNPVPGPLPADLKSAPRNPTALPDGAALQLPGEMKTITMVPYGATHLRLTTLPVIMT